VASLLDNAVFVAASGGTGSFTVSTAAPGHQLPAARGGTDGKTYRYRAQSSDLSEWEEGSAVASSTATVFTRVVAASSAGGTTTVNFTAPPTVAITIKAADILQFDDAMSLTAAQKSQGRANLDVLKKNYIINGAMMVSQQNGTTAGTTSGYYPVDEWQLIYSNGGAVSIAQVASTTPAGSPNRFRVTVTTADAAVAAGDYSLISTRLEGLRVADLLLGTSSAKTFTMQFGVKAPAGTYGVEFRNSAANRAYLAEFTISAGEANTDVVKSVTLTGDLTGTWLKDTGVGLGIYIALMAGSSLQGTPNVWSGTNIHGSSNQFNFMGTISNVFELFDVSLTEGSAAPAFQVPGFASELALCQRYWEKSYDYSSAVGATTYTGSILGISPGNVNRVFWNTPYSPKRSAPTLTAYSPQTGTSGKAGNLGNATDYTVSGTITAGHKNIAWSCSAGIPAVTDQLYIHWTADARL
jgi:hypothetical protein